MSLKKILVTGATGNIGRHVVSGLRTAGVEVTAFARRPPPGAGAVAGDLTDPAALDRALDGVDGVFLLWPFMSATGAPAVVEALTRRAERVVYVSAVSAEDGGVWGQVEQLISDSGVEHTYLRAGGLAANTLGWAEQIRTHGEAHWPYGAAKRSLVHEKDIAEVAVKALLTDDLIGARPVLTGPQALAQAEQVALIGEAIGRPLRWREMPAAQARVQLVAQWGDPGFVDSALDYWASIVDHPEPVSPEVEQITGHPARTFAEWARDHADDFR